ncbi:MAG TPA: uracil-DNA glycosylase [Candidatus Saccharimonadales bacterium]|nr:uracil-DNA glycosylase [Candidatus Saccharimonadales bacterium]
MASDKQAQLDQIAAEIVKHNVCPDLAKTAKHLVFGEGSPDAKIIFIGEAPGKNEDITGRPFIGAAGKFLSDMLESISLKREDVYITSILKYRPPNNRDPRPEEKTAFWPYLKAQLDIIQPVLIVTLGRHAANCFLPELMIGKAHGQLQMWEGRYILALYHPAAALYNSSVRQTIMEDFAKIPAVIASIQNKT